MKMKLIPSLWTCVSELVLKLLTVEDGLLHVTKWVKNKMTLRGFAVRYLGSVHFIGVYLKAPSL